MQPTYLRDITTEDEKKNLYDMMDNDAEAGYRAKIILLRNEGYTTREIRIQTNRHDNNIRKWIHKFNSHGIDGILSRKHYHTAPKITDDIEKEIVQLASTNPRKLGLKFSTWSLRVLVGYVMEKKKIVDSISHAEIRNVLLKHGIEWRHSKAVLGKSIDPVYDLKKAYWGSEE